MTSKIHPTAQVHPKAIVGRDCVIGPYSIIGENVQLGNHTEVRSHVVLEGPLEVGSHNVFHPFSVIGGMSQDLKYSGECAKVIIGDYNVIREYVTINKGTQGGGNITRLGNKNLIMAYCHIAHDCIIEDECVLANAVSLCGHVTIETHAIIGGMTGIAQFCRVGAHAYIAGGSEIRKDIAPFVSGKGGPFRVQGINLVGLRRRGFTSEAIKDIKTIFHILITRPYPFDKALSMLAQMESVYATHLINFCKDSKCGLYRRQSKTASDSLQSEDSTLQSKSKDH